MPDRQLDYFESASFSRLNLSLGFDHMRAGDGG